MQPRHRNTAYFCITDDNFDPAEITASLGVQPTSCWRKGDAHPAVGGVHRKSSRWSLHSRLDESASLEKHAADVLDQMDEKRDAFAALMRDFYGELRLVGYFAMEDPHFHLSPSITERIGRYLLSLDCDFHSGDCDDAAADADRDDHP